MASDDNTIFSAKLSIGSLYGSCLIDLITIQYYFPIYEILVLKPTAALFGAIKFCMNCNSAGALVAERITNIYVMYIMKDDCRIIKINIQRIERLHYDFVFIWRQHDNMF